MQKIEIRWPVAVEYCAPVSTTTAAPIGPKAPIINIVRPLDERSDPPLTTAPATESRLLSPIQLALQCQKAEWAHPSPTAAAILQAMVSRLGMPIAPTPLAKKPAKERPASLAAVQRVIRDLGDGPEEKMLPLVRKKVAPKRLTVRLYREARDKVFVGIRPGPRPRSRS